LEWKHHLQATVISNPWTLPLSHFLCKWKQVNFLVHTGPKWMMNSPTPIFPQTLYSLLNVNLNLKMLIPTNSLVHEAKTVICNALPAYTRRQANWLKKKWKSPQYNSPIIPRVGGRGDQGLHWLVHEELM